MPDCALKLNQKLEPMATGAGMQGKIVFNYKDSLTLLKYIRNKNASGT